MHGESCYVLNDTSLSFELFCWIGCSRPLVSTLLPWLVPFQLILPSCKVSLKSEAHGLMIMGGIVVLLKRIVGIDFR